MPVSHFSSFTGEPSSDRRHSAYDTSEPKGRKGAIRRFIYKETRRLSYIHDWNTNNIGLKGVLN